MPGRPLVVVALLAITVCLPAQVPAHAVLLNPTASDFNPLLVQRGATIHACGIQPDSPVAGFVHYSRSLDGGRTWPLREVPLAYASGVADFAVDGDLVVVLVHSQYLGPHTITSTNGGTTWALPVKVSQQNAFSSEASGRLHMDGTTVNVVWLESRSTGKAWSNRSIDGGATWRSVDTQLDVGMTVHPASAGSHGLEIVANGSTLHALWVHDALTGPQTLHQRSVDGGSNWLVQPTVVATSSMQSAGGDGNLLFVSRGSPLSDLRSTDGGTTWAPVSVPGMLGWQNVAVDDANVLVTRGGSSFPGYQLLLNVSRDGGATWLPSPYVIVAPSVFLTRASIVGDVFLVHVRFLFIQNPPGSVIQSGDGGVSWRLLTDEAALGLWPSEDHLMVTTRATPSSNATYAYVLAGHSALGSGTAGTGGLVPQLQAKGQPTLGRTFVLEVSDGLANSPGAVFASFAPAAPTPLGSVTVYVQQPVLPLVFTTSSLGVVTQSVTLPASAAFAGLTLTSQAFVLDPAAADGFSATRALETWIR